MACGTPVPVFLDLLRAAVTYFALAFAAGFACGCVRVPLLVPRLGERTAVLLEAPVMFVAIRAAARATLVTSGKLGANQAQRGHLRLCSLQQCLLMGALALVLLLVTEVTMARRLTLERGQTLGDWYAQRDSVGLAAYVALLAFFAAQPAALFVAEKRKVA